MPRHDLVAHRRPALPPLRAACLAVALVTTLIAPHTSAQSDVFRFRVAVLDFSVDDLSGAVSDPIAVGRAIAAEFDEPLLQARRFIVLERRELVRVFDEQSLTEEGLTAEVVRRFGELFAADAIITGRVTVNPSGTIRVLAKIVDVKTGEVVVAHGLTAADIEARDQIATDFVNLALVQFPLRGRIVAIEEDDIYINLGVAQGLTSRDATGAIYRERRIADLDVSERIGTFRVIEVLPEASRIEATLMGDRTLQVGDTIEILPIDDAPTPEPPPGSLLVRGTPVGATILVNGTVIGTLRATGFLHSLPPGTISLELRADGYEPDRRQVDIVVGRIVDVVFGLTPSAPGVEVQSVPVAAGSTHAMYVRTDGTVWAWGRNAHGQLGDGSTLDRVTPVQAVGLADVVAVASGLHHSLALRSDGTVWAWGSNDAGQLGIATATVVTAPARINALRDVVAVAAGLEHSLALLADGSVSAWGRNELGQLGDGTTTNRATPVPVRSLNGVRQIAAGGNHALALLDDGSVWAWGHNDTGQLGDGGRTNQAAPVRVTGLRDVRAMAAGGAHSLALRNDGSVWAWGWNGFGQVGDGTNIDRTVPVLVADLDDVRAIGAGLEHSLAVRGVGSVWVWGANLMGQTGVGSTSRSSAAVEVHAVRAPRVLVAGGFRSLAVTDDGRLLRWGSESDMGSPVGPENVPGADAVRAR